MFSENNTIWTFCIDSKTNKIKMISHLEELARLLKCRIKYEHFKNKIVGLKTPLTNLVASLLISVWNCQRFLNTYYRKLFKKSNLLYFFKKLPEVFRIILEMSATSRRKVESETPRILHYIQYLC